MPVTGEALWLGNDDVEHRQTDGPARPAHKRNRSGLALVAIVFVLAMANFLAILDLTIVNVLVPHISGALAVATSDGTWVITSYAVAEAIMVPLTGWIAERFGPVRVFVLCIAGFGVFSLVLRFGHLACPC